MIRVPRSKAYDSSNFTILTRNVSEGRDYSNCIFGNDGNSRSTIVDSTNGGNHFQRLSGFSSEAPNKRPEDSW